MNAPKIAAAGALLIFCAGPVLFGQSVAEAAKKEKERREALKGKGTVVVTNADLAKTKKKPAVTPPTPPPAPPAETEQRPAEEGGAVKAAAAPAGGSAAPARTAEEVKADQERRFGEAKTEIENRLRVSGELISLLKLKMTALQQQFYSFNVTTPRDQIQRDISDTFVRLQAAMGDEAKAKDDLAKLIAAGPAGLPQIR